MKIIKPLQLKCSSVFAPYINEYIEQRRAIGFKYNTDVQYLNQFDRFCVEHNVTVPIVSNELLTAWLEKYPNEKPTSHYVRSQRTRAFVDYCRNSDIEVTHTLHPLRNPTSTFTPYIFTHDEIRRLLIATDVVSQKKSKSSSPIIHLVLPLLFRMLYACGLRITETLLLKNTDVDLEEGVLRLLGTKGEQARLVPMSESLISLCRSYRTNPLVLNFGSEYFFPAPDRGFYDSSTIYARFRECLFEADISHGGRGKGPRLHDIRHTFAVHTLDNWVKQGKDLYVCLPILSVYLGHTNGLSSTQQYLRLVPEAYSSLTNSFEAQFSNVFPEVLDETI